MKVTLLLLLALVSAPVLSRIQEGFYIGVDPHSYMDCEMEVTKVDHDQLRPSRFNRTVLAKLNGIPFRLRYRESYDFQSGVHSLDARSMEDAVQIGYRIFAGKLFMNPQTNNTTVKSFVATNRLGQVRYCDNLKYIGEL